MERVTVNVGGLCYETTAQTLQKIPALKHIDLARENYDIFIDRDGIPFGYILSYLRTRVVPELDIYSLKILVAECEYYQLLDLKTDIANKIETQSQLPNDVTLIRQVLQQLI